MPNPKGGLNNLLLSARKTDAPLSEDFLQHFTACLRALGRRLQRRASVRAKTGSTKFRGGSNSRCVSPPSRSSPSSSGSPSSVHTGSSASAAAENHYIELGEHAFSEEREERGKDRSRLTAVEESDSDEEDWEVAGLGGAAPVGLCPMRPTRGLRSTPGAGGRPHPGMHSAGNMSQAQGYCPGQEHPAYSQEWLDWFCQQDVRDQSSSLTSSEKIWIAVARTDNNCGELLGQGLWRGYDGVRNWICCLLTWSWRAAPDMYMPRGCSNIVTTRECLAQLMQLYSAEFRDDDIIQFLVEAIQILCEHLDAAVSRSVLACQQREHDPMGRLLAVHCGHNGWPGKYATTWLQDTLQGHGL